MQILLLSHFSCACMASLIYLAINSKGTENNSLNLNLFDGAMEKYPRCYAGHLFAVDSKHVDNKQNINSRYNAYRLIGTQILKEVFFSRIARIKNKF